MLARLRALDPPQPLWQILFYRFGYWLLLSFFVLFYRARFFGTPSAAYSPFVIFGIRVISNPPGA